MSSLNPQAPVFSVSLSDAAALHRAYMPFIDGGGVFVARADLLPLGTEVTLQVSLMNEPVAYTVSGRVIWLTPNHAQDGRVAGMGVQLDAASSVTLLPIIEAYLADAPVSQLPTYTM